MISAPSPDEGSEHDGFEEPAILAEINITPLTDVFLVLLIIFMVGASISVDAQKQDAAKGPSAEDAAERGLQINTPEGTGSELLVPKDVVISVLPDGSVYVDDAIVPVEQLSAKLREVAASQTNARVVIRGDEAASYRLIMDVISKARGVGLTDVALSTRTAQ